MSEREGARERARESERERAGVDPRVRERFEELALELPDLLESLNSGLSRTNLEQTSQSRPDSGHEREREGASERGSESERAREREQKRESERERGWTPACERDSSSWRLSCPICWRVLMPRNRSRANEYRSS